LGYAVVSFLFGYSLRQGQAWTKYLQLNLFAQSLVLCVACFLLWNTHPTKDESLRLSSQLFFNSPPIETSVQSLPKKEITPKVDISYMSIWLPSLFPRKIAHQGLAELSIYTNAKLKTFNVSVPKDIFESLKNYGTTKPAATDWAGHVLALYGKRYFEPCRLELGASNAKSECFFLNEKTIPKGLPLMLKEADPKRIVFDKTKNVTAEINSEACFAISDNRKNSEHFLSVQIQLLPGLNHILLSGNSYPVGVSPVIYFISKTNSVIIPGVGHMSSLKPQFIRQADGFDVIYNLLQETNIGWEQNILLNLDEPEDFQMRFQHSVNGITVYRGQKSNRSEICEVQLRNLGVAEDKRKIISKN
jgi:hypothetical protein